MAKLVTSGLRVKNDAILTAYTWWPGHKLNVVTSPFNSVCYFNAVG